MDIVFVHGAFMTGKCWFRFSEYFTEQGYRTRMPDWPGKEAGVEALRRDPAALRGLGLTEIVNHYARLIGTLPDPPLIIGHSIGGLVTELLLDRGLGRAGVAICPAAAKGVLAISPSALRAFTRILIDPRNRRGTVTMSVNQFRYAFAHTMPLSEVERIHADQVVPETGRIFFQSTAAMLLPNPPSTVDYTRSERAPLLIVGAELDHATPARMVRATFRRYRSGTAPVDHQEFAGRTHWIIAQPGWGEVAAFVADWLTSTLSRSP
jgi:pimeloyl-ACP methyl ester carboxylesterase